MNVGLYARISTFDQNTLPMQMRTMRSYVKSRKWKVILEIKDTNSGASKRPERERLLKAARKREIDAIIVWRLDRWGRSVTDLLNTLQDLNQLEVGFISITEALDFTTATGRAMAALLAVFAEFEREILRERVKAGIAQAKLEGKPHGRPATVSKQFVKAKELYQKGLSKSEIARKLKISRTSIRRMLIQDDEQEKQLKDSDLFYQDPCRTSYRR